jgi:hypothetical protein
MAIRGGKISSVKYSDYGSFVIYNRIFYAAHFIWKKTTCFLDRYLRPTIFGPANAITQ